MGVCFWCPTNPLHTKSALLTTSTELGRVLNPKRFSCSMICQPGEIDMKPHVWQMIALVLEFLVADRCLKKTKQNTHTMSIFNSKTFASCYLNHPSHHSTGLVLRTVHLMWRRSPNRGYQKLSAGSCRISVGSRQLTRLVTRCVTTRRITLPSRHAALSLHKWWFMQGLAKKSLRGFGPGIPIERFSSM